METELEAPLDDKNGVASEKDSDEELELEQIKRKKFVPLCIIDSDSNSGEGKPIINGETKDTVEKSEDTLEMGMDVSAMVQKLLLNRDPDIPPLQCSECGLDCPTQPALEFHTKLHVMEMIVQRSYEFPEIGLKKPSKEKKEKHIEEPKVKKVKNKVKKTTKTRSRSISYWEDVDDLSYNDWSDTDSDYVAKRSHKSPYKCEECGVRYKKEISLKRHMRKHTRESGTTYMCEVCGSSFPSKTKLNRHMVEHSEKRPFRCKECTSKFKTYEYLEAHMLLHVTSNNVTSTPEVINDMKSDIDDPSEQHILNDVEISPLKMKKMFNAKNKIKKKIDKPSAKRPFRCKECNSRFKTKHYLEAHMLLHGVSKRFKCTICEYKCAKKALLTRHMLKHTGSKNHACPICEYRCNEKGNLAKHMVIHGDDRPFSCPEEGCDYRCKLKSNLKNHIKGKHLDDKRYKCHICDYRSIDKNGLNTHLTKHTGIKAFPCPICEKRFPSKSNLTVHMRIHTNNKKFGCHLCDYRCFTKGHLNAHMLRHTKEQPFQCEQCPSRFKKNSNLRKHMRKFHGVDGKPPVRSQRMPKNVQYHTEVSNSPQKIPKNLTYHSEVSNSSSQAHHSYYQENTHSQNIQHLIGGGSIMGRHSEQSNNHHNVDNGIMGINAQSLNQHIIGATNIMGRNIQETASSLMGRNIQETASNIMGRNIQETASSIMGRNIQETATNLMGRNIQETASNIMGRNIQETASSIMGRNIQETATNLMGRNNIDTAHLGVNFSQVGWHGYNYTFPGL